MGVVSWNRVLARIVRNPSPLNDARLLSSLFASFRRGVVLLRFSLELIGHPCSILRICIPSLPIVSKSFRKRARLLVYYTKPWNLFVIPPVHRWKWNLFSGTVVEAMEF